MDGKPLHKRTHRFSAGRDDGVVPLPRQRDVRLVHQCAEDFRRIRRASARGMDARDGCRFSDAFGSVGDRGASRGQCLVLGVAEMICAANEDENATRSVWGREGLAIGRLADDRGQGLGHARGSDPQSRAVFRNLCNPAIQQDLAVCIDDDDRSASNVLPDIAVGCANGNRCHSAKIGCDQICNQRCARRMNWVVAIGGLCDRHTVQELDTVNRGASRGRKCRSDYQPWPTTGLERRGNFRTNVTAQGGIDCLVEVPVAGKRRDRLPGCTHGIGLFHEPAAGIDGDDRCTDARLPLPADEWLIAVRQEGAGSICSARQVIGDDADMFVLVNDLFHEPWISAGKRKKNRYDLTNTGDIISPMKRSDLSSLDDLHAFETVARLGSVRAAAADLNLTHGAVSRRVSNLSDHLGIRLLEPDGRGLRLTKEGVRLAQAATDALSLVSAALEDIRKVETSPPIVVSCERSVAMRWLIPRLSEFQDRHPDIDLHLSVGGGSFDFARERITLAIRRLDFAIDPRWHVERMIAEEVGPVMHPDMAERFSAGNYVALAAKTRPDAWSKWSAACPNAPKPRSTRWFDHHFLMVEAAASGLGVAMCPKIVAIDDIRKGRLVAPMGFQPDGSHYGIIRAPSVEPTPSLDTFVSWLLAGFNAS
jgi:DNA-binding transcriptional LysR family regulator